MPLLTRCAATQEAYGELSPNVLYFKRIVDRLKGGGWGERERKN